MNAVGQSDATPVETDEDAKTLVAVAYLDPAQWLDLEQTVLELIEPALPHLSTEQRALLSWHFRLWRYGTNPARSFADDRIAYQRRVSEALRMALFVAQALEGEKKAS